MKQRRRLLSEQFNNIINCFLTDIEAVKAAKVCRLNRNTINKYYYLFRKLIYTHIPNNLSFSDGICEIDESYFGPRRFRGKSGKLEGQRKIIVFEIIQRGGIIYTEIVPNIKTRTLYKIIKEHISTDVTIYSDECTSYNYLKVKRYKHETVIHSKRQFVKGDVNTNSIESYWSYCKRRLSKFIGINRKDFHLHIKECAFRFNNRQNDLYQEFLKLIKLNRYLNSLLYNETRKGRS